MGIDIRNTVLILIFSILYLPHGKGQQRINFQCADSTTQSLYEQGDWKALASFSRRALEEGIDYFYLRFRAGVASYMKGNYRQAEIHLEKALEFNPDDKVTTEYLYYSYLMQNKMHEALAILQKAPESLQTYLQSTSPPREHSLDAEAGWFWSDQGQAFRQEDLDGRENIYGETDILNHAWLLSAGGKYTPVPWYSAYLGYTFLSLDRNRIAMSGDSIMQDRSYTVSQHQVYHSGNFFPGQGITIRPAFHYLHYSLHPMKVQYDPLTGEYHFPDTAIARGNFIGFLALEKDFSILRAGIFGAAANLNEQTQYQAGFDLVLFPAGNLDLYLQGQFVVHVNEADLQPVGVAMAGARLFRPLWLELSGSWGEVENYFEKNASAVYNFPDRLLFKYEMKLLALLSPSWQISVKYQFLGKEAGILAYKQLVNQGIPVVVPELNLKEYNDHFLIAGILWKL